VSQILDSFGRAPDILINNLGVGNASAFEELSDLDWARSFDINIMGTIRTRRALLPQMAKQGSAAVVNTDSDLAKQPEPSLMDHGVCKAGLLYLTKALARQYVPHVRVNAVLPGPNMVANVDTARWNRGSTRSFLRCRKGSSSETVLVRALHAAWYWRADRCGSCGRVSGVTTGQVYYGLQYQYRRHTAGAHLTRRPAGPVLWHKVSSRSSKIRKRSEG
jgi:NAD(P)-dependent dehydrogenase (short-subunit alcohol dehydrogenase family)